jgi:broad specificity phosphatase PhoE
MTVTFAVMRHAATAWNAERRLQGMTDTPLSTAGITEASGRRLPATAHSWRRESSPLQRARRTAELLRPAAVVATCPALREMSFGAWEGFTIAELRESIGQPFLVEERKGLDFQPPGGESPRAVMARIAAWAERLDEPVVAISHKAVIRALLALATGWDMTAPPPHRLDWRCLHFFEVSREGTIGICRLNVPFDS